MFPGRFSFFFGTGISKLSPAADVFFKKKKGFQEGSLAQLEAEKNAVYG